MKVQPLMFVLIGEPAKGKSYVRPEGTALLVARILGDNGGSIPDS